MLWTGSAPAQRFRNAVRDLTLEVGARNSGAIGMQFNASNQGTVRNVTIRAAEGSGRIGLDLGIATRSVPCSSAASSSTDSRPASARSGPSTPTPSSTSSSASSAVSAGGTTTR